MSEKTNNLIYREESWKAFSIYTKYRNELLCFNCGHRGLFRQRTMINTSSPFFGINCTCRVYSSRRYVSLDCQCSAHQAFDHIINFADSHGWLYDTAPPSHWNLKFDEETTNGMY